MVCLSSENYGLFVGDFLQGSNCGSIPRIGGSDTNAVVDWFINVKQGRVSEAEHFSRHIPQCSHLNGFYAKNQSTLIEEYIRYLEYLNQTYVNSNSLTLCNWQWLRLFYREELNGTPYFNFPESNLHSYAEYAEFIQLNKKVIGSYSHFESLVASKYSFLHQLKKGMAGKKVLVVNPFVKSFEKNKGRINYLFKNFSYGNISFEYLTSPVTYPGVDSNNMNKDWFDTMIELSKKISNIDCDLVLLSCGSYALPLCPILSHRSNKKLFMLEAYYSYIWVFLVVVGKKRKDIQSN